MVSDILGLYRAHHDLIYLIINDRMTQAMGSLEWAVQNNELSGNTRHGINIKGADLVISTNRIMGNADSGISIDRNVIDTENVAVNFNTIVGNTLFGLKVDTGNVPEVIDAENNFWGDSSGPEDLLGTDEADNPPCFDPTTMKNADAPVEWR